jgi:hypothetical protein
MGQEQASMMLGRLCCSRSKAVTIANVKRCKIIPGLMLVLGSEDLSTHAKQSASWALRRLTEVSEKMRTDLCGNRDFLLASSRIISGHAQAASIYANPVLSSSVNGMHHSSPSQTSSSSRRSSKHTSPVLQPADAHSQSRPRRMTSQLEHANNDSDFVSQPTVTFHRRLSAPDMVTPARAESSILSFDEFNERSPSCDCGTLPPIANKSPVQHSGHPPRSVDKRPSPDCSPEISYRSLSVQLPPLSGHGSADGVSMPAHGKHTNEHSSRAHTAGTMGPFFFAPDAFLLLFCIYF